MITSPEEFIRLRTSDRLSDYSRASNEEAPLEVWKAVLDSHPEMEEWVAHNKTIPEELIERLARSGSAKVRLIIAMKRRTSGRVLEMLARDRDDAIRLAVARHPHTSDEALLALESDLFDEVRRVATARRSAGHEPS